MSHYALLFAACTALLGCGGAQSKSSGVIENVPYCAGGNRATSCITDRICATTSQGCQVCRCETLDE
jgi:hypothetical protein